MPSKDICLKFADYLMNIATQILKLSAKVNVHHIKFSFSIKKTALGALLFCEALQHGASNQQLFGAELMISGMLGQKNLM